MDIKILGSGCAKCAKLEQRVREVVEENHLSASIEKVEDFKVIMGYGVMKTPALVRDEKVLASGSVPSKKEIRSYLVD
jgi:small redox-active disulfide protein 2